MISGWVTRKGASPGNMFLGSAEVARKNKAADQARRKKTRNVFANERAGGIDLANEGAGSAGEDSSYGSQDGFCVNAPVDQESTASTNSSREDDDDDFPQISDVPIQRKSVAVMKKEAAKEGGQEAEKPAAPRKRPKASVIESEEESAEESEEGSKGDDDGAADNKPQKKKKRQTKADFTEPGYWTVLRTRILDIVQEATRGLTIHGIQKALDSRFRAFAARQSVKKNVERAWNLGIFDVEIRKGTRLYCTKKSIGSKLAVQAARKADATRVLAGRRSAYKREPGAELPAESPAAPSAAVGNADMFAQMKRLAAYEAVRAVEANPKMILLEKHVRLLRQTLKTQDEYARRLRREVDALRTHLPLPTSPTEAGKLAQSQRDRARMSREIALLKKQLRSKGTC